MVQLFPKRSESPGDGHFAEGLGERPLMPRSRMIEQMMEDNGPLQMVAVPAGKGPRIDVELFDQSLLVRGNDVHVAWLGRSG